MKNSSVIYNANSNDNLNTAIEKTKSNRFNSATKLLLLSATFLNDYYNFNFSKEKTSDENNFNISDFTTLQKEYKYTSYCPYSNNKSVRCLSLEWMQEEIDSNSNYNTLLEFKKNCQLRIACSYSTETTAKDICCKSCQSKKQFEGLYEELFDYVYFCYLEETTNYKKNIKYLRGQKHFEDIYRNEALSIVEAATGSGKTYNAVQTAMRVVREESRVAIIAFPTLKLLIQTNELIKNLKEEEIEKEKKGMHDDTEFKPSYSLNDIDVYLVTLASNTKYNILNKLFLEGLGQLPNCPRKPKIFLTVHSYFKLRGDAPEVAPFAALILYYKDFIWLAIDEVHNFVNSCTWKLPYESMMITKKESNFEGTSLITPWSMKDLNVRNLRSIDIIRGILSRIYEDQGGVVWKLKGPISGKYQNSIEFSLEFEDNSEISLNTVTFTKRILGVSDFNQKKNWNSIEENINIKKATQFKLNLEDGSTSNSEDPHLYLAAFEKSILQWRDALENDTTNKMQLPNTEMWLSFLLRISYRPSVVFYRPYSRSLGRRITLAEFKQYHEHRYKSDIKYAFSPEEYEKRSNVIAYLDDDDTDEEKKKLDIIFPKGNLPFTSEITAMNMFPVYLATQCKTCTFISATVQEYHSKFIQLCSKDQKKKICHVNIASDDDKKLDELIFVTTKANWFHIYKENFWLKIIHICEQLANFYTIGFCENQGQAKKFFDWLSNYTSAVGLILEGKEIRGSNMDIAYTPRTGEILEDESTQTNIIVASALGVMGTGLNLPEQKLVFFNMGLYKPISVFWHCRTSEEAKVLVLQDLISSVQQTLGRNMRMTQKEKDGERKSRRVTFFMGINNFRGLLPYLMSKAKESFKNVKVIDLIPLEKEAVNITKNLGAKTELENFKVEVLINKNEQEDGNKELISVDNDSFKNDGLSRIDILRMRAVLLMSSWLQDIHKGPFNTETIKESINNNTLLVLDDRKQHFAKMLKVWLETSKEPSNITWRGVTRKFNLFRESFSVRDICFEIFTKFKQINTNLSDTEDRDIEIERDMHERQQEQKRLLSEIKEVPTDKIKEVFAKVETDVNLDLYKNEDEENDAREIVKAFNKIYSSTKELNLLAKNLVEQYCAIFPYELSIELKSIIEKNFKATLKLLSKKGLEIFKLKPQEEFTINFVNQLIWNYFCVEINVFLKERHLCLLHPPINLRGSYHNEALLHLKSEHFPKLKINIKNIWESLEADFKKHKELDLYNKYPLFTKIAVYYFLYCAEKDDEKILKGFVQQIGKRESGNYTQKKLKTTEDYKKLQEVCEKITKILLNSKLINDFRNLSAELLNQGIRRDSSHTDYLWDIFKKFNVYPTKVLEDIEFDNEKNILSLSRLKKAFPEVKLLGHFAYGYKNLQVFIIPESKKQAFIEKIIDNFTVKNNETKIEYVKLSQIESAQDTKIYNNTLTKIL